MYVEEFFGRTKLIKAIDTAVLAGSSRATTDSLRRGLCKLMHANEVELPECVLQPIAGRYARRQLYQSEEHGYCIVAMTWGPGQGTPIHDHSGMWCVEAVWRGMLEVIQYERLDNWEDVSRFRSVGSMLAGQGSVGSLIPPHEYHAIRNPSEDAVTVSLHVYAGNMTQCAVFEPIDQALCYQRIDRRLCLDPMTPTQRAEV